MRIHVRVVPGWLPMLSGGRGIEPTPRRIGIVSHASRIEQRKPQRHPGHRATPKAHRHSASIVATKVGRRLSSRKSETMAR